MSDHLQDQPSAALTARIALLRKEKALTRMRDEIAQERRALPRQRVTATYEFISPTGSHSLGDLFAGRSQLLVYHFMFDATWDEGCVSCSLWADHYGPSIIHLAQRDVTLVTISNAPIDTLEAFRTRMGWTFDWVSCAGTTFGRDFNVSFDADEVKERGAMYNYVHRKRFPLTEAPGISVFQRDADGSVHHTYSTYARGLESMLGMYAMLDIVPKGRNEENGMSWVRHRDRYGTAESPCCEAR